MSSADDDQPKDGSPDDAGKAQHDIVPRGERQRLESPRSVFAPYLDAMPSKTIMEQLANGPGFAALKTLAKDAASRDALLKTIDRQTLIYKLAVEDCKAGRVVRSFADADMLRQFRAAHGSLAPLRAGLVGGLFDVGNHQVHEVFKKISGGYLDPNSGVARAFDAAKAANSAFDKSFRSPGVAEITRWSREAIKNSKLVSTTFDVDLLRAGMGAMQRPWLSVQFPEKSAWAFGEIQAIGRLINQHPFDEPADRLRPTLGDWRESDPLSSEVDLDETEREKLYAGHGYDRNLTEFPVPAFEEAVRIAGLVAHDAYTEADDRDWLARNKAAFDLLQRLETAIRHFIDTAMRTAHGDDWPKHRTGHWTVWNEKRERAVKEGLDERPIIEYADFTDYKAIIERNDNWNSVFKPFFGRPSSIAESFQRLFPVRNAVMHGRPITSDDAILLYTESRRILRAIAASKVN